MEIMYFIHCTLKMERKFICLNNNIRVSNDYIIEIFYTYADLIH